MKPPQAQLKFSGDAAELENLVRILNEIQVMLGLPSIAAAAVFSADMMQQIMEKMLTDGLPIGFYEAATSNFDEIQDPFLKNLLQIAAERKNFPEDPSPSS